MKTTNSYTVTQINNHAKSIVEKKLEKVYVKGEVSSFKKYESGHAYFILKDFSSEISCTIFNYNYPYQAVKLCTEGICDIPNKTSNVGFIRIYDEIFYEK